MAQSIVQAGSTLYLVTDAGVMTPITMPTGVTLRTTAFPRFATYGGNAIVVNTPSQPIAVNSQAQARLLTPKPPRLAPIIAGASGGTLSGTYTVKETFVTLDQYGNLLSESDYSALSNKVTITSQYLAVSNADISPDQITLRRFYRTTSNGAVYFQWVDLDGNVLTTIQDDLPDAALSLVAAPVLGTPPNLTLVAEFRDRIWGVGDVNIDDLRYTEVGRIYAWPEDNVFPIPSVGSDNVGIKALMPRREALGIGRQNQLLSIIGSDETNFQVVKLSQNCGVLSQESVAVYRDIAYFLWEDGVYSWSDEGILCLSDGNVRSWFAGDSEFNRSQFQYAFGVIDPVRNKYRLHLNTAGSTTNIAWVEYDLNEKTWWGPHMTTAFTPTSSFILYDGNLIPKLTVGGLDANLYRERDLKTDGNSSAVQLDVVTKRYAMGEPDLDKYWGELSIIGKAQTAGTLTLDLAPGEINATQSSVETWDMTQPRQRLQRVGTGKHLQLEMVNTENAQDVEIYDIEVNPVSVLGRR